MYRIQEILNNLYLYLQLFYRPSNQKVEWATQLIKEFCDHEAMGKGAFTFRGSMIDAPLVKQAQNIVDMAKTMT